LKNQRIQHGCADFLYQEKADSMVVFHVSAFILQLYRAGDDGGMFF